MLLPPLLISLKKLPWSRRSTLFCKVLPALITIRPVIFTTRFLDRCSYNSGAVSVYQPMSCEAYGALVEGSAICEGYAKAFKLLCNRAGIACEIVGGTVNGEAHMWNYVQIGGDYYLVDATFDDAPGVVLTIIF